MVTDKKHTTAAVIGGGIAGCCTAYLLAKQGVHVTLYEKQTTIASGASGNPVGMLYPRINGDENSSQFALNAYLYSCEFYRSLHLSDTVFKQCGMLQLGFNARELTRIKKVAKWLNPTIARMVTAQEASEISGMTISHPALYFPESAWLKPQAICQILLSQSNIQYETSSEVTKLTKAPDQFCLEINQQKNAFFDSVVIANAHDALSFSQTAHVNCTPVRGQLTQLASTATSRSLNTIMCSDGYFSPAINDIHTLGATFDMNNISDAVTPADHALNLAKLAPISLTLAETLANNIIGGRSALRCCTIDHLPMVGEILDAAAISTKPPRPNAKPTTLPWIKGLYINIAHGSHGLMTAPFTSHCLSKLMLQQTTMATHQTLSHLNPNRHVLRQLGLKKLAQSIASATHTLAQ